MAVVKTIDVAITATTSAFDAAMKRSVITFDAFAIASKAAEIATAAFQRVVDGVTDSMQAIDAASKAAASIGIATDQLMSLRFALDEIAGVDPEKTDAMLTRMIRNIAEGGKPAQYAIQNIGLSLDALQKMTPQQAFLAIRDAIAQLPGQGQKASAAFALFGRQGAELLPLFTGTSEALRESMGFAQDFGLAVSTVDAAGIEMANDALNRVAVLLEGMFNQLAVEIAPAIYAASLAFVDLAREAWPSIQTLIQGVGELAEALWPIVSITTKIANGLNAVGGLGASLGAVAGANSQLDESVKSIDFNERFQKHLQEFKQQMKEMQANTRNASIGSATGAEQAAAQQKAAKAIQSQIAKDNKAREQMAQKTAQKTAGLQISWMDKAHSRQLTLLDESATKEQSMQQFLAKQRERTMLRGLDPSSIQFTKTEAQLKLQSLNEENAARTAAFQKRMQEYARFAEAIKNTTGLTDQQKQHLLQATEQNRVAAVKAINDETKARLDSASEAASVIADYQSSMEAAGRAIKDSVATPQEVFKKNVENLDQAFMAGIIDKETLARAFAKEQMNLPGIVKGPEAITGGPLSGEAFSAFQANQRGLDAQQQALVEAKKHTALLQEMKRRGVVLAAANLTVGKT